MSKSNSNNNNIKHLVTEQHHSSDEPTLLGGKLEQNVIRIAKKPQHIYCEQCLVSYSIFCLGCCCDLPLSYGIISWYLVTIFFDIYTFIATEYSMYLGILYLCNLVLCTLPTIYFTFKRKPKKIVYPFMVHILIIIALFFKGTVFLFSDDYSHAWKLYSTGFGYIFTAAALIAIFTERVPL